MLTSTELVVGFLFFAKLDLIQNTFRIKIEYLTLIIVNVTSTSV